MYKFHFSPCPNDTFMFDALVNGRIDTLGMELEYTLNDIEWLNQMAIKRLPHLTKISAACYPAIADHYQILPIGAALGVNNGPLLVASSNIDLNNTALSIAVPGMNTTANKLLAQLFPHLKNKKEMLFSEIEGAVLNNKTDAGLLIHEGRFTHEKKGLKKLADLGELWFSKYNWLLPLGFIVIKRDLPAEIKQILCSLLRQSVHYAFENPDHSSDFIKIHAQEMDAEIVKQHIKLYVNEYSLEWDDMAVQSIKGFFKICFNKSFSDDSFSYICS